MFPNCILYYSYVKKENHPELVRLNERTILYKLLFCYHTMSVVRVHVYKYMTGIEVFSKNRVKEAPKNVYPKLHCEKNSKYINI